MKKGFELESVSREEIARRILLRKKFEAWSGALDVITEHGGDWMKAAIEGFASVILDDPDRDKYEYDFFDPQLKYRDSRGEITRFLDKLEVALGVVFAEEGEWADHNVGGLEKVEYRIVYFETKIPGVQIRHVEYRSLCNISGV